MSRILAAVCGFWREPRVREVLRWSLPALVAGLIARVILTVHLPFGYYHIDAQDFFHTPDRLSHEHKWDLHGKKTFLVPILYTIACAIPGVPALVSIPIAQHLVGLATVLCVGGLCRLWFRGWKIAIIPLTLVTALNPFLLWHERTLIAETIFVFCTVLVAFAGTLYARKQTPARFIFFSLALFLEAGARPEGKLLFGFGILLVLTVHRRSLRTEWRWPAIMTGLALITHLITRTTQAGLLLYTAVARLTPTDLRVAPGFDPYIAPIRASLQTRWEQRPQFPRVADRKAISAAVKDYLTAHPEMGKVRSQQDVNRFCMALARETCVRNLSVLPMLAVVKFSLTATDAPADGFTPSVLHKEQLDAFADNIDRTQRLSVKLTGRELRNEEDVRAFLSGSYHEVDWFNRYSDRWLAAVNAWRLRDTVYADNAMEITHRGMPIYFIAGALGLLAVMFRRDEAQAFHVTWGWALLGFFFVIMLTANVRPRFRFVFEPFWFAYGALLLECVILALARLGRTVGARG